MLLSIIRFVSKYGIVGETLSTTRTCITCKDHVLPFNAIESVKIVKPKIESAVFLLETMDFFLFSFLVLLLFQFASKWSIKSTFGILVSSIILIAILQINYYLFISSRKKITMSLLSKGQTRRICALSSGTSIGRDCLLAF